MSKFLGIAISLLMLASAASPALGQNRYPNLRGNGWHRGWFRDDGQRDRDFHIRYGLNNGNWNSGNWGRSAWTASRAGTAFDGANPAAIAAFDARVNQLRGEVNARGQGRLNSQLNSLLAMRAQFTASGGALTVNELEQLNARLNELRIGLRSRVYF
jgi:hypothetical protein